MPRVARIVIPGLAHHVTQRGNNRQEVFFVDDDRATYLKIFADQCRRHRVAILAYCLMTNHVHHLVVPAGRQALALALGRTHWLYTQYINHLHGRSGHLWQNRFFSCAMDDDHTLMAARYVEKNPVRAGLCRIADRWKWSSAAAHCTGRDELGILDLQRWHGLAPCLDWKQVLAESVPPEQIGRIRRCLHTGRPLASDNFLAKLEKQLGRRLRALATGRPKGIDRRSGRGK